MITFSAIIEKFAAQGEKTGWTYIKIPCKIAQQLKPGNKKSFRIKGSLDKFAIEKTALLPMGDGNFILPLNAAIRKGIGKRKGAEVRVSFQVDNAPLLPPALLLECMADEPEALQYFNSLPQSHRNYFTKWIDSAKTDATRAKRIALVIRTMINKMDFGAMLRLDREERKKLLR
jgi:Domain of unknown function (DUF1905)/Bacteriocin-protection, YdeI or OmpD-Associated